MTITIAILRLETCTLTLDVGARRVVSEAHWIELAEYFHDTPALQPGGWIGLIPPVIEMNVIVGTACHHLDALGGTIFSRALKYVT